jgi:hypothetical protein
MRRFEKPNPPNSDHCARPVGNGGTLKKLLGALVALTMLITIVGCGTAPRPTPAATLAPVVITVVVTATPPATIEPTMTPTTSTTSTVTANSAVTQTLVAARADSATPTTHTASATATRRPATATPTKAGTAVPTKIPSIAKYTQPVLNLVSPLDAVRDVRNYGSDTLQFEWASIGPLGTNECYLIRVDTKSNADQSIGGDTFLFCDTGTKATQAALAQTAIFTLNKPNASPGPNYSGISPPGGGDVTITWSVWIARDDGPGAKGDAYYWLDGSRRKYTLLSPQSATGYATLRGAPVP